MSVSEESEVVLHLSHCQECRNQLESLTAEPEFWREVGEGLRPTSDGSDSYAPWRVDVNSGDQLACQESALPQRAPLGSISQTNPTSQDTNPANAASSINSAIHLNPTQLASADPAIAAVAGVRAVASAGNGVDVGDITELDESDALVSNDHVAAIQFIRQWLAPTDDPTYIGRLGSYEILGVIGVGGMGVVLKGFDPSLHRSVAIKVLGGHLTTSGAARQRFAREAQAAASVVHENVLAIHAIDQWQGVPYFVMPLVRGESLEKRLKQNGPFDLLEILRIARQIAAGLDAAHQQGLVHRDIKPANILMEHGSERLTISDFGLARAGDDASLTRSGLIMGTPLYMSPEQARGDRVDTRSDIFSFGSLLYALCTGHPPFRAETPYGVIRRLCEETPREIQQYNPTIPFWFSGIIAKMMHKNVEQRISSAHELLEIFTVALSYAQQSYESPLPKLLSQYWRPPQLTTTVHRNTRLLAAALLSLVTIAALSIAGATWTWLHKSSGESRSKQETRIDDATKAGQVDDNREDTTVPPSFPGTNELAVKDETGDLKQSGSSPGASLTIPILSEESPSRTDTATDAATVAQQVDENQGTKGSEVDVPKVVRGNDSLAADWQYRFQLDETLRYRCQLDMFANSDVMQVTATIDLQTVELSAESAELNYELQVTHLLRKRTPEDPELGMIESPRRTTPASPAERTLESRDGTWHIPARPRGPFPSPMMAPTIEFPFFASPFGSARRPGPFAFELEEVQACEPSGRVKIGARGGVLGSSHQSNLPGQIGPILEWIFPILGEREADGLYRYQRELQLIIADADPRIGRNLRGSIVAKRDAEFQQKSGRAVSNGLALEFVISDWQRDQSADTNPSQPLQTLLGTLLLDRSTGKLESLSMSRSPVELSPELQATQVEQLKLSVQRIDPR